MLFEMGGIHVFIPRGLCLLCVCWVKSCDNQLVSHWTFLSERSQPLERLESQW